MNLKGKKILVTGGSGFIGTNLQKKLKNQGVYIENFDKGNGLNIENTKQLESFVKKKFDVIFHLAGASGSSESNRDPQKSFEINTFATVNLCEQILKYSPKTKLVISSSRLEYGKPLYLPVDEKHPTNPTSIYGLSKLASTQMALLYRKNHNLDVVIFRTSNVYGPHPQRSFSGYNIVNFFIDQAKEGKDLTIYGNGEQKRDYLYVDDLVEAFIHAATAKVPENPIFNLGLGKPIKFKDMAQIIISIVGRGKLKFVKWPKDFKEVETGDYVSAITKIKKELGFRPKIDFEEGIRRSLKIKNWIW